MNQHLSRLKTHLVNEAAQQTDITDRSSFVSSVRTRAIPISESLDLVSGGLHKEAEQIRRQEMADNLNRNAEILNITDRFCACGLMATLELPDPTHYHRKWRCEECASRTDYLVFIGK